MDQRTQIQINALSDRIVTSLREAYGTRDTKHEQAWHDYGYKESLEFNDYYQMSERFGVASAGITIPVDQCWKTKPEIREGQPEDFDGRKDKTDWESNINRIFSSKKMWRKIKMVDEYQRVGDYGAFAVQVRGSSAQADWKQPLNRISDANIVKFIPLYQEQLQPTRWEQDPKSERYGQPTMYQLQESQLFDDHEQDQRTRAIDVHWSRVIIFAEGADDDSIYGRPALKRGFNDLVTMEKIIGAGGEGFWKSAAMKTVYTNTNKDAPPLSADEVDSMDEAISKFVEGLDKHLMTGGLDPKVLSVAMSDPENPFNISLQSFSASVGVAAKLLIGSQEGRLAADEDGRFTLSNMQSRRESWCTQMMESIVDWLMTHGVIEEREYTIEWDDLLAPSDDDKLSLAQKMSQINKDQMREIFTDEELRKIAGYEPLEVEEELDEPEGGEGEVE